MTKKDDTNQNKVNKNNLKDWNDMIQWIDDEYEKSFAELFSYPKKLYEKIKTDKITEHELENLIINLPINLIEASERLSRYKSFRELANMDIKRLKLDLKPLKASSDEALKLQHDVVDDQLVVKGHDILIERIEKEISLSKELIMGAKKVYDSRKASENANPIGESTTDKELPEY